MTAPAPVLALRPADLPLLTVLVHPEHDPRSRSALRVLHTADAVTPWLPFTGDRLSLQHRRMDNGVVGWQLQSFAEVLGVFNGEVR